MMKTHGNGCCEQEKWWREIRDDGQSEKKIRDKIVAIRCGKWQVYVAVQEEIAKAAWAKAQ